MALISFWVFLPSFSVCFWNIHIWVMVFFEKSFENQLLYLFLYWFAFCSWWIYCLLAFFYSSGSVNGSVARARICIDCLYNL